MKKGKKDLSVDKNDKYISKEQNKDSNNFFLNKKRKNSFDSKEESENEQNKKIKICKFCKNIIGKESKINLDNTIINDLTKFIFNDNKELKNSISNSLINSLFNNDEKKKKIIFLNNLKKYCDSCKQKIIKNAGISNANLSIKTNYIYNKKEELNLLLYKNNEIEEKIKEIIKDLDFSDEEKNINININNKKDLINQIKNKLVENVEKLKDNNKYLKNIIENNNFKNENELINRYNNKNIEKNEKNYNIDFIVDNKDEINKIYKISDKNSIICPSKYQTKSDSLNSYTILSKEFIYESKYEKIKKYKLSKIFQYNSFNQFKNYIHNFPVLINKTSNYDNGKNIKNCNLINSLSDIKNLENNSNFKKIKINSMSIPVKYQSEEVEQKILKLKELDNNNYKIYKNRNIDCNSNSKILNNKKFIHNNGFNNNNNLDIGIYNDNLENNINNKNLLLKYLISSYQVNQELLNQIHLGGNSINKIFNINNNDILNNIINENNIDGNINTVQNLKDNSMIKPSINSENYNIFNSLNQILNKNNNINGNLNFYNNMQSFYNQNLMNHNLNKINIGPSFNHVNEVFKKNNILYNKNLDNINKYNIMTLNTLNKNSNSCFNIHNISEFNSFSIGNMNKKDTINEGIKEYNNEKRNSENNNLKKEMKIK